MRTEISTLQLWSVKYRTQGRVVSQVVKRNNFIAFWGDGWYHNFSVIHNIGVNSFFFYIICPRWQCLDTERTPSSYHSACCVLEYPRTPSSTISLCTRVRSGGRNLISSSVIKMLSIFCMIQLVLYLERINWSRKEPCMYHLYQAGGSSMTRQWYRGIVRYYKVLLIWLILPTWPFILSTQLKTHQRSSHIRYKLGVGCVIWHNMTGSVFLPIGITLGISGLRMVSKKIELYRFKKLYIYLLYLIYVFLHGIYFFLPFY